MSQAPSYLGSGTPTLGCRLGALYRACVHNDSAQLQALLDGGVSPEEATQVDSNGRVSYPQCFPGQLGQPFVPHTTHIRRVSGSNTHCLDPWEERRE